MVDPYYRYIWTWRADWLCKRLSRKIDVRSIEEWPGMDVCVKREGGMAYDEGLLERCLDALRAIRADGIRQKNVFGMRGLLLGNRMFAAVGEESIIVKSVAGDYAAALTRPGITAFSPGGSKLGSWLEIAADAVADDPELREWLEAGLRAIREG
jgi:TfoX/Sxy family transcriptional regulator of competence genes